jgi:hypothetical protein
MHFMQRNALGKAEFEAGHVGSNWTNDTVTECRCRGIADFSIARREVCDDQDVRAPGGRQ